MLESSSLWEREKVFHDAVHGAISLPSVCVAVIDTPQFQRLRFLKQLGATYYVYPSAVHTRFEHSLGVSYLAGQLVGALKTRQPHLNITDEDVLCVMLAGLCHDLGHGPFSHMWENFVKKSRSGSTWKHEEGSIKMFDYMLEENPNVRNEFVNNNLRENDITFIHELIGGGPNNNEGEWSYRGRPKEKAFLYEVVANKRTGVDVDKWDYILRDSHSLGIKVTFDYKRIVQFSRVIEVEGEGAQLCVRDKECHNLYDLFHARRILHRTAYQHRVVSTIDAMLIDALLYADKHILYPGTDGKKLALGDVCEDMTAYTYLTDEVFNRVLLTEETHPDITKAKEILKNIMTRRFYLYVGHTQPTNEMIEQTDLMDALERNIPPESKLTKETLEVTVVRLNYGMGHKDPIEKIRFFNKSRQNQSLSIRKEEVSTMLPERFQENIIRLLCKTDDPQTFNDARTTFAAACKELCLKDPAIDSWPSILTPVKIDSSPSPDYSKSNMKAARKIDF